MDMAGTTKYVTPAAFIGSIVAANYLTQHYGMVNVGFGLTATAGTYAAGAAFLLRDYTQERTGRAATAALIIIAGAVTYLISPALAVASATAFLISEFVDMAVYIPLRRRGFYVAAFLSNVTGAIVDTFVFLHLAGFPITPEGVEGQLVAKILWATLLPLAILRATRR